MSSALVLLPSPAIGHLISMVELGKFILSSQPSLSIHILIIPAPYSAGKTSSYIENVAATVPSIYFHHLPAVSPHSTTAANHETLTFEVLRLSQPNVCQILISISETSTVNALVLDFFCAVHLSVASALKIPCYFFYTSPAACLALFLYTPINHRKYTKSFKDLNGTFLDVPGLPPIPATDMPKPVLDRNDKAYEFFLEASEILPKASGIIINTYESLEPRPLKAISEGQCVPDSTTPPIFCIGPLIATRNEKDFTVNGVGNLKDGLPEWLTWLDSQPSRSVVFLCFGSLGLFSKEQLMEIAIGLERSGQRFLWVVRNPPAIEKGLAISAQADPDLDSLLPDGFLTRTKDRGYVVKSWAPQVAVLNHDSVGGFVTHCGWNSVLEAVWAGVPMVAWPLYAEQRFNRIVMVQDMKIALSMDESEDGFVTAMEVEKRVTELMESESGKLVREQTIAMKKAAKEALSESGSSRVALSKLTESWKRDI
ncbi:UDP-glycosyltransferase 88A1 [Euphorbia lathyris]|uniref:UDP-glycosyltransferase 88A1 n=1 Tax=Euphorbia lathyris TaxID=212925 RepID=UPI003313C2DC